jgi:hypothetical protein
MASSSRRSRHPGTATASLAWRHGAAPMGGLRASRRGYSSSAGSLAQRLWLPLPFSPFFSFPPLQRQRAAAGWMVTTPTDPRPGAAPWSNSSGFSPTTPPLLHEQRHDSGMAPTTGQLRSPVPGVAARSSPLLSLPPLLLFSDSWWWRWIWMGIRETGWGLGFYRAGLGFEREMDGGDPWHPRLGTRHTFGYASMVGAAAMGGWRELLAPPRHASRERIQRGKERWERADRGVHLAVTQGSGRW